MKNTNFFLKCILALLPFLIFMLYTGIFRMGYMDKEYPSWKYTKEVQKGYLSPTSDEKDTVVILGDSRAMADLDPVILGENSVNLAFGGATAIEMYYTLKDYINNHDNPKAVMIFFAPFHYSYMDNYWTRTVYFHHLSFPNNASIYQKGMKYGSDTISSEKFTKLISSEFNLPDTYLPAITNARLCMRYNENKALYNSLCDMRGHAFYGTADGCSDLNYESSYETMRKTGDHLLIDEYLNILLTLCESENIPVYLDQVPMNTASYSILKEDFVTSYTAYLEELALKHPGCNIESEIPCYPDSHFGDSSHLNQTGAELFSYEIRDKYNEAVFK